MKEHGHTASRQQAIDATLHCLTGCAIGEITGLIIGTVYGLSAAVTVLLSVCLAFVFGYTLSLLPLLRAGFSFQKALPIILAADTLSIATMELVDNAVMVAVPGAMGAGLVNPLFWLTMPVAFALAFVITVPVNQRLIERGKGHTLVHAHHHNHKEHAQ